MQKIKIFFEILILIIVINFTISTICRDGSTCPGRTTCCLTPRGVGCCPFVDAVCCSDGINCCPHGFICARGTCFSDKPNSLLFLETSDEHFTPAGKIQLDHSALKSAVRYLIRNCIEINNIEDKFMEYISNCGIYNNTDELNCKLALFYLKTGEKIKSTEKCYEQMDIIMNNYNDKYSATEN